MKINKNSITPKLENSNFIERFVFSRIYFNVLKKVKKENFKIIFDFGSGYRNLYKINLKYYKFKYQDFDIVRNKELILTRISKLQPDTLFISLNVFMYLDNKLIINILKILKKNKIKMILNISKNYPLRFILFLFFKSYKNAFVSTNSYASQMRLINKYYNTIYKKDMFFSDILFCEPKN